MTRVSVASVRITNPDIRIMLCCDRPSFDAMKSVNDLLLEETDEINVFEVPDGTAEFRNRYIKTNLRGLIDGAFLFLDSDTFVRGDLSYIYSIKGDVAGARNHSKHFLMEQIWSEDDKALKQMNWRIRDDVYINGGVLYFNDTRGAYQLAERWHRKWQQFFRTNRLHRDQPSLNASLYEVQPTLVILDDKFNAQFRMNLKVAHDAVIWHYYATDNSMPLTAFEHLVKNVQENGELSKTALFKMVKSFHPWQRNSFIEDILARLIVRRAKLEPWLVYALQGKRLKAISCLKDQIIQGN
jgi:hypothetical protein